LEADDKLFLIIYLFDSVATLVSTEMQLLK